MQSAHCHKSSNRVPHLSGKPSIGTANPIIKGSSRPSSGVGVLLLDVIGNDVKVGILSNLFSKIYSQHAIDSLG
jgi:hypothetical protein